MEQTTYLHGSSLLISMDLKQWKFKDDAVMEIDIYLLNIYFDNVVPGLNPTKIHEAWLYRPGDNPSGSNCYVQGETNRL